MNPRPPTLKAVAERSESLADFGRNLRDWLHELRLVSSRPRAALAVAEEPPRLHRKFAQGEIADAWLAAYAEHLAHKAGIRAPDWSLAPSRVLAEPAFDDESEGPKLRVLALAHAPMAFKRRNIYTPSVDLPLSLRAGRPRKSAAEIRQANASRQRRFRAKHAAELSALRKLVRTEY